MDRRTNRHTPAAALPAMSYTTAELKPVREVRPTDEAIQARAHQIWLEREGEPGNPTLDWLQAEMELIAELRTGKPVRPAPSPARRPSAASQIEERPQAPRAFARGDAQQRAAA